MASLFYFCFLLRLGALPSHLCVKRLFNAKNNERQTQRRKENHPMLEFTAVSGRIATMQRPTDRNGFTLVELAVSLVVIGLLIGLGTSMVGPLMSAIKVRESRENLGAAVESINSWAAGNNSLPDTTNITNVVRTPSDAWGRDFIYLYDANLAPATATKDTICGRKTTRITVRQCLTADCTTTSGTDYVDTHNVVYVVLSKGDDATIETTASDAAITASRPFSTGADVRVTLDYNNSDLVRWATLDELRTKVGCQGPQLRIVNNELPFGYAGVSYPAAGTTLNFSVDGGATPSVYRWCIEAANATPLPSGLDFSSTSPTLPIRVTPTNSCRELAETNWGAASSLTLSTAPLTSPYGTIAAGTQGSYSFTVYVRDNNDTSGSNDNIAAKAFVLTINP